MGYNSNRNIEIAGIGACVADMLYQLDHFPKEDTKLTCVSSKTSGGGPVATGLCTAARLGCNTAYLGVLGEDVLGDFLFRDFRRYHVDISGVQRCDKEYRSFTSCIWLNKEKGSRTCVLDKGTLPAYIPDETAKSILGGVRILMVDGNELEAAISAADFVHHAGGKVLYDAGGLYSGIDRLLFKTDFLIPSAEFAMQYTGRDSIEEAARALYEKFMPETVVITDGSRGGIFYQGKKMQSYPAFPVEVLDSNGAGDVFHGAFAAALVKGLTCEECCIFASMASALKCRGFGARESVPELMEVWDALRKMDYAIMRERGGLV